MLSVKVYYKKYNLFVANNSYFCDKARLMQYNC